MPPAAHLATVVALGVVAHPHTHHNTPLRLHNPNTPTQSRTVDIMLLPPPPSAHLRPLRNLPAAPPPARAPPPELRLSDEALNDIAEIILLDAKVVAEAFRDKPLEALETAQRTLERRKPLLSWTAVYLSEKLQLCVLEETLRHVERLRAVAPSLVADAEWQRSHVEKRLSDHRASLRSALLVLKPTLLQRVLQAAKTQPLLIPSISHGVVKAGVYRARWSLNRILDSRGLRRPEHFAAERDRLVGRWLRQVLWVHRSIEPWRQSSATAADILYRSPSVEVLRGTAASTPPGAGDGIGGHASWWLRRARDGVSDGVREGVGWTRAVAHAAERELRRPRLGVGDGIGGHASWWLRRARDGLSDAVREGVGWTRTAARAAESELRRPRLGPSGSLRGGPLSRLEARLRRLHAQLLREARGMQRRVLPLYAMTQHMLCNERTRRLTRPMRHAIRLAVHVLVRMVLAVFQHGPGDRPAWSWK